MKKSVPKISLLATLITIAVLLFFAAKRCGTSHKPPDAGTANQKHDFNLPVTVPVTIIDTDSAVIKKKAAQLDKIFKRLQRLTGFNGTVLYAEKGRIIFKKAYGWRNVRRRKDHLSTSDRFQLASVSKMFSAYAIMLLKKDGKLSFDDDIRKWFPRFPYQGITLRLLMNHRSGLPRYMSLAQEKWKNKKRPLTNDSMMALLIKYHPGIYFSPNSGFHYCNTNYALLANVVEAVSGMHFEDFIKKRIFEPLGMDSSFVYSLRNDTVVPLYVDKGVPGWYHRGWRWRRMTNDYLNGVVGDKNIYTSVEDLYKFDKSLDNFKLLPDSIIKQAFTPGSPRYWKRRDNYGFGWRIRGNMDSTVYHFGWWKGFRTFYIRDMRHHKTLIVLTNKDKGPGSANFWNIIKSDTLPLAPAVDY
jgi:CubicO group peptidase (beta-lactamase class C family)